MSEQCVGLFSGSVGETNTFPYDVNTKVHVCACATGIPWGRIHPRWHFSKWFRNTVQFSCSEIRFSAISALFHWWEEWEAEELLKIGAEVKAEPAPPNLPSSKCHSFQSFVNILWRAPPGYCHRCKLMRALCCSDTEPDLTFSWNNEHPCLPTELEGKPGQMIKVAPLFDTFWPCWPLQVLKYTLKSVFIQIFPLCRSKCLQG